MAGKSKSMAGKSKSSSSGSVDDDTGTKPFKCCISGKTFLSYKAVVSHSPIHKKRWVCTKDYCALVVNLSKLGHEHLKVLSMQDDGAGTSSDVIDWLTKAQMKKQCKRY